MLCYMYSMLYLFITDNQNGMPDAVYYYNGTGIQYVLNVHRVPGCSLSDKLPENGILKMENGKCLPNHVDNIKQRENYIVLVERIMTNIIPCLQSMSDVTTSHIPHCYREKCAKKQKL